jgi:hypothetical protein
MLGPDLQEDVKATYVTLRDALVEEETQTQDEQDPRTIYTALPVPGKTARPARIDKDTEDTGMAGAENPKQATNDGGQRPGSTFNGLVVGNTYDASRDPRRRRR